MIDLCEKAVGSALCAACMCRTECDLIVKDLLEKGADANFCANEGLTPLFIASYHGKKSYNYY